MALNAVFRYTQRISMRVLARVLRLLRLLLPPLALLTTVAVIGIAFYVRGRTMMEAELRGRLMTVASTAAVGLEGELLDAAAGPGGAPTSAYDVLVRRLYAVRQQDPSIRFAYILRQTSDPRTLEFVADADALSTEAELDRDGDGTVGPDEQPAEPGETYDATEAPALQGDAFLRPTVDEEATTDQWGSVVSGYAPIRRADGSVAGTLGIDMDAAEYLAKTQSVFSPIALLLVLLAAILIAGHLGLILRRRRMDMLRQVDAERTALMDLASHQLGGPIATFRWWLEILRDDPDKAIDTTMAYAQMEQGLSRMQDIMRALQDAHRLASGKIAYTASVATLEDVIRKSAADVLLRTGRPDSAVRFAFDPRASAVRADVQLLSGAVAELLENALAYSPGSTEPILVRTHRQMSRVRVDVQDRGIGIPADELPKLFLRFTRGRDAHRYKPVGNGLGLYLVRTIIEMAGGKVRAESKPGNGSTFSFWLPVAE